MSTGLDTDRAAGVEFIHVDDGSITARDIETGVASFGDTKADALAMLADALRLHDTDTEIDDEAAVLRDLDIDPDEVHTSRADRDTIPEFMR